MVRPLRVEYEDAYYHVMNRGRGRQFIFHGKKYYQDFLTCLSQAHQRFGIEIHAYCLMGNHYHLLIKTPRGNLGRAMRHINGVYTQKYNHRKKTDGALFRGRYKAILIDKSTYLLEVSRYIHRNPVEMKKPLVDKLSDYEWSSYQSYIGLRPVEDWLVLEDVYGELGSSSPKKYCRFVDKGLDEETALFYEKNHWPAVRGDKAFLEQAHQCAINHDIEIAAGRERDVVDVSRILTAVTEYYNCSLSELKKAKRGRRLRFYPRWIAMKLCQDLSGLTLEEISRHFGVGHYSSVSRTVSRLNRALEDDGELLDIYNGIYQDLTPKSHGVDTSGGY
ncbi:MAG: transposase [Kangiellaceae bacterium]|jgi:REP element-mobilizing transposase RayT|nr:transposase [Kangiellaceae bacterium]